MENSDSDRFKQLIGEVVDKFNELDRFRIVSHYDADGISAASIILATCLREGKDVHLSIVKQIKPEVIESLKEENFDNIIFTDLGSGYLDEISELDAENVFVLDHHQIKGEFEDCHHINPHLVDIEENSISGAGVTYLLAKSVSEDNKDLATLAVIGAIGDSQEDNWEMQGLNKKIVEEAIESDFLTQRKGLRLYGRLSRPIHKALMYTTRPYIPGVSENESGAIQFLSDIDIDPKDESGSWKKLVDLTEEEKKTLGTSIIQERMNDGLDGAEEIFGDVYTLNNFNDKFKDAREFSTALNACGRMNEPEIGILSCIGDSDAKKSLKGIVRGYKRMIGKYIRKVRDSKDEMLVDDDNLVWIEGGDEIHENFIGTVVSILQSSMADGKVMMGFAESSDGRLKVSARVPDDLEVDLGDILEKIAESLDCDAGGHEKAGGGYIEPDCKEEFINMMDKYIVSE